MKLEIVQAGDPVLRGKSRALTKQEIGSPEIQRLIELMRDTMREAPGVGLAAPQIGVPIQLAVIEDPEEYLASSPRSNSRDFREPRFPFTSSSIRSSPSSTTRPHSFSKAASACLALPQWCRARSPCASIV